MEYRLNDNEVLCYDFGYQSGVNDALTEISKIFNNDLKIEEIKNKLLEKKEEKC